MHPRLTLCLRLALLIGMLFATLRPAQAASTNLIIPRYATDVSTDGTFVVWLTPPQSGGTYGIYGASLADRKPFPIATETRRESVPDRSSPAIDSGIVVWVERDGGPGQSHVRARNLLTGESFVVASAAYIEGDPAIDGDWVVWRQVANTASGPLTIAARNIRTMSEPVILAQPTTLPDHAPRISGTRVVWGDLSSYSRSGLRWQITLATIGGGAPVVIAEGAGQPFYDLHGDLLVYAQDQQIVARNLQTGATTSVSGTTRNVTTDGRYIFWSEMGTLAHPQPRHLRGYDLATNSAFDLEVDQATPGTTQAQDVANGVLVWLHTVDGTEIHARPVADVLPSAPRPAPTPNADRLYFMETGHTLASNFKTFWENSGGLPVFGFPLTEEFSERNADTGTIYPVQYFERQRFEYHSEKAGTPYAVLLGRLGAAEAEQRQLLGSSAFAPLPASTRSDASCTFFATTAHRICTDFLAYWHSAGLEFGDPGVSERESLALFGLPLSEAYMDAETGLLTQYFERARFEYHPDKPEPYRVLLGRLSADTLVQRGWRAAEQP